MSEKRGRRRAGGGGRSGKQAERQNALVVQAPYIERNVPYFEILDEVFVPKGLIYKNLSHLLHRYYQKGDKCVSSEPSFWIVQSPVFDIFLQRIL